MAWMTHNPAFESPERLVERFVVRHHELDAVLRVLRENDGPVNQHVLILAPRGRGKTMLVQRVAAETRRDPELAKAWFPVVFGEESYNVATLGELWLEALLHLADATGDPRWRGAWESLHRERDERRLVEAARARLLDFADSQGKRLVLVVENLDTLVEDQLSEDDAWALRRVLLEEPRLMLLGTAVHRFPGVEQPDKPLFDLFKRLEIPPLDDGDTQALWQAVTGHDIGGERAAAIRVLTGGSPRLTVLLADFSDGRDLRTLLDDLAGLIDQHTDYFKHNIESLSTQQRRVFLALAELWVPSSAREVADAARMDVNVTSAQLKRLEHDGRVEIAATRGRSHVYQVSERLYNIYYLMRRRGGVEGRVRALIDFIRNFYQPAEVPGVIGRIAAEACGLEDGRRAEHLWLVHRFVEERRGDRSALLDLIRSSPVELFELPDLHPGVREAVEEPWMLANLVAEPDGEAWLPAAERVVESAAVAWAVGESGAPSEELVKLARRVLTPLNGGAAIVLAAAGRVDEVLALEVPAPSRSRWARFLAGLAVLPAVDRASGLRLARCAAALLPYHATVKLALGARLATDETTRDEGLRWLRELTEQGLDDATEAGVLVRALHDAAAFDLARDAADQALSAWPDDLDLWQLRYDLEWHGGEPADAERIARGWMAQSASSSRARSALARAFLMQGKLEEAADLARGLVREEPEDVVHQALLAYALFQLSDLPGAVEAARRARSLEPTRGVAWSLELRAILHDAPADAEVTLAELTALSPRSPDVTEWGLHALLQHAPAPWLDQAASWATRLLGDPPTPHHAALAARIHGRAGNLREALALLAPLYRDAELVTSRLDAARDDAMRLAAAGAAREALEMLRNSAAAPLLEPLVVALAELVGERMDAPLEVREVAQHVRVRIEGMADSGDPWRVDPRSLPITRAE